MAIFFSHYSFSHFRLSFWDHFPSSWNISFKISCSECLLLVKSVFDSLKKCLYFAILKDVFTGSIILGWQLFPLGPPRMLFHSLTAYIVSVGKSTVSHFSFVYLLLASFSNIPGHFLTVFLFFVVLFIVCIVVYSSVTNCSKT